MSSKCKCGGVALVKVKSHLYCADCWIKKEYCWFKKEIKNVYKK